MKYWIMTLVTLFICSEALVAQSVKTDVFQALEDKIQSASVTGDTGELDKLLAPDYIGISISGQIRSKVDTLKAYREKTVALTAGRSDPKTVRRYGQIAIVVGIITVAGTNAGSDISGRYAFTRVYRQEKGTWQAISFEATPIK